MVMLGDILAAARRSACGFEHWLRDTDAELAAEAASTARAQGLSLAGYARMAVADFSYLADEEDWATLISGIRESPDPGRTCLAAMIHWRLTAAACAAHSPHPQEGSADG